MSQRGHSPAAGERERWAYRFLWGVECGDFAL